MLKRFARWVAALGVACFACAPAPIPGPQHLPPQDEPVEAVTRALTDPCELEGYPRDAADLHLYTFARLESEWSDPRVVDEHIFGHAVRATYRVHMEVGQVSAAAINPYSGVTHTTSRTRVSVIKRWVLVNGDDICISTGDLNYPCVPFYEWVLLSCDSQFAGGAPWDGTGFNSMGFRWGGGSSNMQCEVTVLPFGDGDPVSTQVSAYLYSFRGTVDTRFLGSINGTLGPGPACNITRDVGPIPHYVWNGPGSEETLYAGLEVYNDHYSTPQIVATNVWVTDPAKLNIDGEIEYWGGGPRPVE